MISIIALLLVQEVSVEIGPRSELVAPDHQHFWQEVVKDDETSAWHDTSWAGTHQQDEKTYRVLLFRAIPANDSTIEFMDLKLAFDCPARRIGIVDSAIRSKPEGATVRGDIFEVEFNFAKDPPGDDDVILLNLACGKSKKK